MASRPPLAGALVGTVTLFALAALITIAAFLTFVAPWDRQTGFYQAIAIVCAAEFVFFAWALNWTVSARTAQRVSGATLVSIHVLIGIWLLISLATSIFMAHPPQSRNYYADAAALIQAALTVIFFALAYTLYLKDLALQRENRQARAERRDLQVQVPGVEDVQLALRQLASRFPDQAAGVDRLAKQVDMIRTSLDFAPPAKIGTLEEDGVASTLAATNRIVDRLQALKERAAALDTVTQEEAGALLGELRALVEAVDTALRERQRLLTS